MKDFDFEQEMYEPTEANEILLEASEKLYAAIKTDVAGKIQAIADDNKLLLIENKMLREELSGMKQERRRVEEDRQELQRMARRMPLSEFMGQRQIIYWKVGYKLESGKKCDKCDDSRDLHYTTPAGRKATEKCSCYQNVKAWEPVQVHIYEMKKPRGEVLRMWYKKSSSGDNYSGGTFLEDDNIYSGGDYADLSYYSALFTSEEEAEKYCQWLSENEQ
jgi:regulator of replication initiation timing